MTAIAEREPTLKEKRDAAWFAGELEFLCRRDAQSRIYNWLHNRLIESPDSVEPFAAKCHRRLGKSYALLLLLYERCLKYPGQRCVFGAPTYEQVRNIVIPNLQILLRTAPDALRPHQAGYRLEIRNPIWKLKGLDDAPSTLDIVGVNYRNGDLLRGSFADAVGLDEVREISNLRYLVEDVLLYQFAGRKNPWLGLFTTMPKSADHDFEQYFVPKALANDRYIEIPVNENNDWTERDEQMLLSAIGGGKDSISWRREALCESVSDEEEMILPEFARHQEEIICEYKRPAHFFAHTCLDTGWNDWNAALLGYVDFKEQRLIVEDEVVLRYKSTGTIVEEIRTRELAHFGIGGKSGGHQMTRFGDLTDQALEDMRTDHSTFVRPVEKWDRDAAIANLRTGIQEDRIRIHPRCKNLIYQCRNGTWNKQRTQFERTPRMGHCDALAALVYLYRMANWRSNPFPDKQVNWETHFDGSYQAPEKKYSALFAGVDGT